MPCPPSLRKATTWLFSVLPSANPLWFWNVCCGTIPVEKLHNFITLDEERAKQPLSTHFSDWWLLEPSRSNASSHGSCRHFHVGLSRLGLVFCVLDTNVFSHTSDYTSRTEAPPQSRGTRVAGRRHSLGGSTETQPHQVFAP